MKYLYDRKIIHRDLSSNNVLIDENYYPIITDFGLSKLIDMKNPMNQSFYGGTIQYTAPEVLENKKYDFDADIYSFGIIMYEVVTDLLPYPKFTDKKIDENELKYMIINNHLPEFKIPIKKSFQQLI